MPPDYKDAAKVTIPASVINVLRPKAKPLPPHREKTPDEYLLQPWTAKEFARFVCNLTPRDDAYQEAIRIAMADTLYDCWKESALLLKRVLNSDGPSNKPKRRKP